MMSKSVLKNNEGALVRQHQYLRQQKGVVLIVALVLLLVMTSVGITTMTGTTLQERMAGNSRQQLRARANAEFALKAAEQYIDNLSTGLLLQAHFETWFLTQNELYTPYVISGSGVAPEPLPNDFSLTDETTWSDANSLAVNDGGGANNPRYVIEYVGQRSTGIKAINVDDAKKLSSDPHVFRITAIGWGDTDTAVSVLQSHYISKSQ